MKHFYRVAVSNSYFQDNEGRFTGCAFGAHCGHLHKTSDTARKCKDRLHARHNGQESAQWYNAKVYRVDADGQHVPVPVEDQNQVGAA